MREQAALDLQAGSKTAHEGQDTRAEPLADLRPRVVTAQAEVVIAPDANRTGLVQERDALLDAFIHPTDVAKDDEAVRTVLPQDRQCTLEFFHMLVDIGQDSDSHANVAFDDQNAVPRPNAAILRAPVGKVKHVISSLAGNEKRGRAIPPSSSKGTSP
jgi:hypothetical protein